MLHNKKNDGTGTKSGVKTQFTNSIIGKDSTSRRSGPLKRTTIKYPFYLFYRINNQNNQN